MPDQEVYFVRVLSEEVLRAIKMDGILNSPPEMGEAADVEPGGDDQPHKPKMNATLKIFPLSRHLGQLAPSSVLSICPGCVGTLFGKESRFNDGDDDSKYPCECAIKSLSTNTSGVGTKDAKDLDKTPHGVLQFGPHSVPITLLGLSSSLEEDEESIETSVVVELTLPPYYFGNEQKDEMRFRGSFNSIDATRCQIRGPSTIKERESSSSGNWLSSVPHVLVCKLVNDENPKLSIDFPLEILYTRQWGSAKGSYRGLFAEYDEVREKYVVKDSWGQYEEAFCKKCLPDGYVMTRDGCIIHKRNELGNKVDELIESLVPRVPTIPRAKLLPLKINKIVKKCDRTKDGDTLEDENNDNPVQYTSNEKYISNNFPIIIGHRGVGSNKIHFVSSSNNEISKIKECSSDLLSPSTPGYRENTLHAFSAAFNIHHNKENDFAAIGIETDLQPVECGKGSSRWTDPESISILKKHDPFCGIRDIAICHEFMAPIKSKSDNITEEKCEHIIKRSMDIVTLQMDEYNNKKEKEIIDVFDSNEEENFPEAIESTEVKLLSSDYKYVHEETYEPTKEEKKEKIKCGTFCNEYNLVKGDNVNKKDINETKERLLSQISCLKFLKNANDAPWTSSFEKIPFVLSHPSEVTDLIMSCIKKSALDGEKSWLEYFNEYYNIPKEITKYGSIPQRDPIPLKPLLISKQEKKQSEDTNTKAVAETEDYVRTFYPSSPITLSMLLSYLRDLNKYFKDNIGNDESKVLKQMENTKEIRLFMNLEIKSLCRRVPWSPCYESKPSLKSILQHPPKFSFVNKELSIISEETYKYVKESKTDETQLPIFFSSFDWMIALLLTSQQNVYPVLYLTLGDEWSEKEMYETNVTGKNSSILPRLAEIDKLDVSDDYSDVPIYDPLARVFPYAFTLCNGEEHGLDGVVSCVKSLRAAKNRELITHKDEINKCGATLLTYGSSIRDVCTTSFLFGGCGVDGVIVDGL